MEWILLSLLYAVTNAMYMTFNGKHHFNGYVLGVWRGFGISLLVSPLLFTVPLDIAADYFLILVMQGIMIGIYDSHFIFCHLPLRGAREFGIYGNDGVGNDFIVVEH